jgi:nucleotide-binding universal stress UspA family protein
MKIMVALDGSKFAEAVIGPVAQLANDARAQVFLVQVVEPAKVHATWVGSPEDYEEAVREEFTPEGLRVREVARDIGTPRAVEFLSQALERAREAAQDYLQLVATRFSPLRTEVVVLVGDNVDEELARFARRRHVDLIAMASHGRTGLARLLMGSHASNMMRYRVAPLMIVRPDGLHQTVDFPEANSEEVTLT